MSTENERVDIEELKRYVMEHGYVEVDPIGQYVLYSDHLAVVEGLRRQVEEKDRHLGQELDRCAKYRDEIITLRSSIDAKVERANASSIDEKIVKKRSFALYKKHITGRGYAWPVGCSMPDDAQAAVSDGMREGFAMGVAAVLEQMKGEKE